ncbi:type II toxin-antitoxin system RelE/ParE family toxin [Streptosporangium sp. NPDC048047]|uniref:type II toxin-antitoxin system RelE family toxin n=1 Tax=Streptosporangium sp. NPDC048047 TaxID=3155748 RepID=UPI00343D404F
MSGRYELRLTRRARQDLAEHLPAKVVPAVWEFITGPLLDNPRRVGKPLDEPLAPQWSARRGEYRVLYLIDDGRVIVQVVTVQHRGDAYRAR